MRVLSTQKSLELLSTYMFQEESVFYTRFGDNDIYQMFDDCPTVCGNNHTYKSPELKEEMRESFQISAKNYLKAASLDYEIEPGMTEYIFEPFPEKEDLKRRIKELTNDENFYHPVLFHYLAAFRTDVFKLFLNKCIKPAKKMFIGNCKKENMEKLFGPIDYYVEVPRRNAYGSIDKWWPEVEKNIGNVKVCLPCAGQATRVINKRLFKMGAKVHSIDIGSVVDAIDGQVTRSWINLIGERVRDAFDDTPNIEVVVPYKLGGNLGLEYNYTMERAKDWVLFLDHDILLLRPEWYSTCVDAIKQVGHKAGWISAVTNRIWCDDQRKTPCDDDDDIVKHIEFSNDLWKLYQGKLVKPVSGKPFSGFFLLTHRKAWEKTGGFINGFLGVDNDYYRKLQTAGYDTYIMPGVYCYHIYKQKELFKV